jgi:hypothetical protein
MSIFQQIELLFIASARGAKYKTYAVNEALQRALVKLADDFDLTNSIHNFLIEKGSVAKRIYRVADLRKFSEYARILGFKDNKRYKPDKLISFIRPHGWIKTYFLVEKAVLPHGADMKLRDALYILDDERYIPPSERGRCPGALLGNYRIPG